MTMDKEKLKKTYFSIKLELDNLRDNITLKRWKILSKAYTTGKKIWGKHFTRQRLAFDMEMPMTTVLRCLSLDRANKRSWKFVEEKKLSVFKLAMICQLKNRTYQDEIADMIIADGLSTYQITTLKVRNLKDINKERHRLACEKGYSRNSSAYRNFNTWIERGKLFLLMDESHLPKDKIPQIKEKVTKLRNDMNTYLR